MLDIYLTGFGQTDYLYEAVSNITSVEETGSNDLQDFNLEQNYPNPFNPTTIINYQIAELSNVTVKVYDVLGNKVATLVSGEKPAGSYEVVFNRGKLSSGIYYYKIQLNNLTETKKKEGFVFLSFPNVVIGNPDITQVVEYLKPFPADAVFVLKYLRGLAAELCNAL